MNWWNSFETLSKLQIALTILVSAMGLLALTFKLRADHLKKISDTQKAVERKQLDDELRDKTAEALSATVALKEKQAPRTITDPASDGLVTSIKQFSGQEYTAIISSAGFDVRPLWESLDRILTRAGWVRVLPSGLSSGNPPAGIAIEAVPGVTVIIQKDGYADVGHVAEALQVALNKLGINTQLAFGADPKETREKVITIYIGPKPIN